MSSRAAGGRRVQLRPLQQPQGDDSQELPPPKPNKGVFLKSKASKPQPPGTIKHFQEGAYPAPSQADGPTFPRKTPSPLADPTAHERKIVHKDATPSTKPPIGPALLSKGFTQQQHFSRNEQPAFRPGHPVSDKTHLNAFYQPPPPPPSTDSLRAQSSTLALSEPTTSSETLCLPHKISMLSLESRHSGSDRSHPNAPRDIQDYAYPSPSFSNPSLASTAFSTPAGTSRSVTPQSSLLFQPASHYPPSLAESSAHLTSRPQTPGGRPIPRPLGAETEAGPKYPPPLPSHHGYNQPHGEGSEGSIVYPSPPSSIPGLPPDPSRWADPSSSYIGLAPGDQSYVRFQAPSSSSGSPVILPPSPPHSSRTLRPQRRQMAESIASSNSSESSSQLPVSSDAASGFVFPGSRSTARPKVSTKTGTPQRVKLNIKTRAEKHRDEQGDASNIPSPPTTGSSSTTSPSFTSPAGGPVESIASVTSKSAYALRLADTLAPIIATANSTSPPTFVFPSSRSLARPRRAPLIKTQTDEDTKNASRRNTRFMGIRLKKKVVRGDEAEVGSSSPIVASPPTTEAFESGSESTGSGREGEEYAHDAQSLMPEPTLQNTNTAEETGSRRRRRGKYGAYPFDPYDTILLDNDRRTGELLRMLNPTNTPTFHNYGNIPPATILDLGCGQGHWVLDAAITWRGYGTRVTGFDMVDTMKSLWPWAISQGVADNITFVRGNFLKQPLPFADGSFDLVRMSCLTLCITLDSWEFVLGEVYRVLAPGGRLELIDDQVFFPYGKAPPLVGATSFNSAFRPNTVSSLPKRASTLSTYSIDNRSVNPGLGLALSEDESVTGILHDHSVIMEEEAEDETEKGTENTNIAAIPVSGRDTPVGRAIPGPQLAPQSAPHFLTAREWDQQHAVSKDLEALFEHMLTHKFGLHINPSVFVLELLKQLFGHAREVSTLHLTLAPPCVERSDSGTTQIADLTADAFSESPGLVLWPSTLVPMPRAELEIHASKHLRLLLSCKGALLGHALDATDDEEIDEDSVLEAIWEYENFLRQRFYPPPDADLSIQTSFDYALPHRASAPSQKSASPTSILSATSMATETQDAMREYQLDFSQHFDWPLESPEVRNPNQNQANTRISPLGHASISSPEYSQLPQSSGRDTARSSVSVAPPYSRTELTHVRTFRVYEAIKMDELTLSSIN